MPQKYFLTALPPDVRRGFASPASELTGGLGPWYGLWPQNAWSRARTTGKPLEFLIARRRGVASPHIRRQSRSERLFETLKPQAANPALHRAPLGYGNDGPLTWVAECRVPWESPGPARLAMARWMIEHGSDVHQGGDGPLMRAALNGYRIPMMELLVSHGANVNALWHGHFPIIFAPCESLDPDVLKWLLDHGQIRTVVTMSM